MKVEVFLAWYDCWIGAYYDRAAGALYVCPLPMCVVRISWCTRATGNWVVDDPLDVLGAVAAEEGEESEE